MTDIAGEATITPDPRARSCEADGCDADQLLAVVSPDCQTKTRVLCPKHQAKFLREVYIQ